MWAKYKPVAQLLFGIFILLSQNHLLYAASDIGVTYHPNYSGKEEPVSISPEVASAALQSLPRPNLKPYFDEIREFYDEKPNVKTGNLSAKDVYTYNITELVFYNRTQEALEYAAKYWNASNYGANTNNQLLIKTLTDVSKHDAKIRNGIFTSEKSWNEGDVAKAKELLDWVNDNAHISLELTTDLIYGTHIAEASKSYGPLRKLLNEPLKLMADYEIKYNQKVSEIQEQKRREEQKKRLANSKVPVISVTELVEAFKKDATKNKYNNKRICITGKVSNIMSKNIYYDWNSPAVMLAPSSLEAFTYTVICNFDNLGKISKLNEKTVTIEGTVLPKVVKVDNKSNTMTGTAIQLIKCELIAYD